MGRIQQEAGLAGQDQNHSPHWIPTGGGIYEAIYKNLFTGGLRGPDLLSSGIFFYTTYQLEESEHTEYQQL